MSPKLKKSDYLLKISLIGSNFILRDRLLRSLYGDYSDKPTQIVIGVDLTTHKIIVKNTPIKLIFVNVPDKAFDFRPRQNYYRGSSACIIIFDKSDRESFEKVTYWLEDFRKHIATPPLQYSWKKGYKEKIREVSLPIAILGINTNEEVVSKDEGRALAEQLDLPYYETSTPKFEKGKEIFEYLSRQVINL